jgi:hypothetical protein
MPEPLSTNFDLSQAKTVVPLIADGHLTRLRLDSLTVETNEKGDAAKFQWKTLEPVPTTDGSQLNPGDFGSTIFDSIAMYAKADAKNPAWFVSNIAKRIDGLLGTADAGNPKGKPARPSVNLAPGQSRAAIEQLAPSLVGKEIVAKMKVRTDDYGTKNEIGQIHFPGDLAA